MNTTKELFIEMQNAFDEYNRTQEELNNTLMLYFDKVVGTTNSIIKTDE